MVQAETLVSIDYGVLTSRFRAPKIGFFMRLQAFWEARWILAFLARARDRFWILLGMGILVFCAALFVHYRVFP